MEYRVIEEAPAYEISIAGQVRNIKTKRFLKARPGGTSAYLVLNLKNDGKQLNRLLHRLIALAFIPNPENKKEVNHKDGNKLNNDINNLEWCSRSENIQHMYDTGIKKYRPLHYKGKFGAEHNRSKKVKCVETGEIFGSMAEAERYFNMGQGCVHWAVNNKAPIHGKHFEAAA